MPSDARLKKTGVIIDLVTELPIKEALAIKKISKKTKELYNTHINTKPEHMD